MLNKTARMQQQETLKKKKQKTKWLTIGLVSIGIIFIVGLIFLQTLPFFKYQLSRVELHPAYERPFVSNNTMGVDTAPVLVEEFSAYSCSFCRTFVMNYEEYFAHNFISNELVQWKFISVTYDDPALNLASRATYCAMDQGKFWEYRDIVFANQGVAAFYPYTEKSVTAFALTLELNQDDFEQCLNSTDYDQQLEENLTRIDQEGITGTPSFLINGETLVVGADPQKLLDAIETALSAETSN